MLDCLTRQLVVETEVQFNKARQATEFLDPFIREVCRRKVQCLNGLQLSNRFQSVVVNVRAADVHDFQPLKPSKFLQPNASDPVAVNYQRVKAFEFSEFSQANIGHSRIRKIE